MSQFENENINELIQECDQLIRSGQLSLVSQKVSKLNALKLNRSLRMPLAKICRRAGLIEFGLRVLHPIMRNSKPLDEPPAASEVCEYAVLLSRNGSIKEAMDLLEQVDSEKAPESLLYRGYCFVSIWDYQRAAECFERYLQFELDEYTRLIAEVNLISAYIAIASLEKAETQVQITIQRAEQLNAQRLLGNCYELRSQVFLQRNQLSWARKDLSRALSIFAQSASYDDLLIKKWMSFVDAKESQDLKPLLKFRDEALKRRHWESVREADLLRLELDFCQDTFDRLVIGTPFSSYRKRVLTRLPYNPSPSLFYGQRGSRIFDLKAGHFVNEASSSGLGNKVFQLMNVLLQDLYAPTNVGAISSKLYPDEYFNVDTSPIRVRQVLRRLRRWVSWQCFH